MCLPPNRICLPLSNRKRHEGSEQSTRRRFCVRQPLHTFIDIDISSRMITGFCDDPFPRFVFPHQTSKKSSSVRSTATEQQHLHWQAPPPNENELMEWRTTSRDAAPSPSPAPSPGALVVTQPQHAVALPSTTSAHEPRILRQWRAVAGESVAATTIGSPTTQLRHADSAKPTQLQRALRPTPEEVMDVLLASAGATSVDQSCLKREEMGDVAVYEHEMSHPQPPLAPSAWMASPLSRRPWAIATVDEPEFSPQTSSPFLHSSSSSSSPSSFPTNHRVQSPSPNRAIPRHRQGDHAVKTLRDVCCPCCLHVFAPQDHFAVTVSVSPQRGSVAHGHGNHK